MNYEGFRDWLNEKRNLTIRSARDAASRLRRVNKMINLPEFVSLETLEVLERSNEFCNMSTQIRCQLKRAVNLYIEFQNVHEGKIST